MEQAHHALIDPLIEPDPSDETGLNSHFRSTFGPQQPITPPGSGESPKIQSATRVKPQSTGTSVETNPYRRSRASSESKNPFRDHGSSTSRRSHDYPSPPNSASPRQEHFSTSLNHRSQAFGSLNESRSRRSSNPAPISSKNGGLLRSSSLKERYPGDMSHRPLDAMRKEETTARRAPHLRKKNYQGADIIDRLDAAGFARYHHEGPYDAASFARNNKHIKYKPLAAVKNTNAEALRATPRENIIDAVKKHRPLEGVANIPPGVPDPFGRVLHYEEGADLQREPGGDYRRWHGVEYHPDDLKGKGEPSFSIEKALKDHKKLGDTGTEMSPRRFHSKSVSHAQAPVTLPMETVDNQAPRLRRRNSTGKSTAATLRQRFGSLRRRKQEVEA